MTANSGASRILPPARRKRSLNSMSCPRSRHSLKPPIRSNTSRRQQPQKTVSAQHGSSPASELGTAQTLVEFHVLSALQTLVETADPLKYLAPPAATKDSVGPARFLSSFRARHGANAR